MISNAFRRGVSISLIACALSFLPHCASAENSSGDSAIQLEPSGYPAKSMLDKYTILFFAYFGRAAGEGSSGLEKARSVTAQVGEKADYYGFAANYARRGRFFKLFDYTCGWWREALKGAFSSAGVNDAAITSVESYSYNPTYKGNVNAVESTFRTWTDPNFLHTSAVVVDNKRIYTFDVWQKGYEAGAADGLGPVTGIGASPLNGMLIRDWVMMQPSYRRFIGLGENSFATAATAVNFANSVRTELQKEFREKRLVSGKETIMHEGRAVKDSDRVKSEIMSKAGLAPIDNGSIDKVSYIEQVMIGRSSVDEKDMIKLLLEKEVIYKASSVTVNVYEKKDGKETAVPVKDAIAMIYDKYQFFKMKELKPGIFEIKGAGPGEYEVRVGADKYRAENGKKEATVKVEVKKGDDAAKAVYLVPDTGSGIEVSVTNEKGEPFAGVSVSLKSGEKAYAEPGETDDLGVCTFTDVGQGVYTARAFIKYFRPAMSGNITILKNQKPGTMKKVSLKLIPMMSDLEVAVLSLDKGSNEIPLPNARVTLESGNRSPETLVTDDDKAQVTFRKLYPSTIGPYALRVQKDGFAAQVKSPVEILPSRDGQLFREKIFLAQGSFIEVQVMDGDKAEPLADANVQISGQSDKNAITPGSGKVSFLDVPPGRYSVAASKEGYVTLGDKETVLDEKTAQRKIMINMYKGIRLKVWIKDKDKPKGEDLIPGSYVSLDKPEALFAPVGTYLFPCVKPGNHKLKAWARGYKQKTWDFVVDGQTESPLSKNMLLEFGLSMTVEVRDERGGLIAGSEVNISKNDGTKKSAKGPAPTFSNLKEGSYNIRASANGYKPGSASFEMKAPDDGSNHRTAVITLVPLPPPPSAEEIARAQAEQQAANEQAAAIIGAVLNGIAQSQQGNANQKPVEGHSHASDHVN